MTDRTTEIEQNPHLVCYYCNGKGGNQISEDEAEPCRACLMTGKCYSNEQVAELAALARSEYQRGFEEAREAAAKLMLEYWHTDGYAATTAKRIRSLQPKETEWAQV